MFIKSMQSAFTVLSNVLVQYQRKEYQKEKYSPLGSASSKRGTGLTSVSVRNTRARLHPPLQPVATTFTLGFTKTSGARN